MDKGLLLHGTDVVHNGAVERQKQQDFFDLAERFPNAIDPEEVKQLGDEMGRIVFGSGARRAPH